MACSEWKVPCAPVMPWQMTRVSLLIRIDMTYSSAPHGLDDLLGAVGQVVGGDHVEAALADDLLAELGVGAFQPHDQRHLRPTS